jgi:hypothetical protein
MNCSIDSINDHLSNTEEDILPENVAALSFNSQCDIIIILK